MEQKIEGREVDDADLLGTGLAFLKRREWDDAESTFTQALDDERWSSAARIGKGLAALQRAPGDEAICELQQVKYLDSQEQAMIYAACGLSRLLLGELNAAATEFDLPLRYDPTCVPAIEGRAAARLRIDGGDLG